jgi:hypothetical protein
MPTATNQETFRRVVDLQAIMAGENSGVPSKIEILQVGTWDTPYHGMFTVSPQDLIEYKANFEEGKRAGNTLPIDYEHITDGGAAGWIVSLDIAPASDGSGFDSLWATVEWTPPGLQALKDRVYKFFSPEFCPEYYVDPEDYETVSKNVLLGGAICTRPLFKKLRAIMASSKGSAEAPKSTSSLTGSAGTNTIYVNEGEKRVAQLDEVRKKKPAEITADDRTLLRDNRAVLSAAEVEAFKLDETPKTDKVEASETPKVEESKKIEPVQAGENAGVVTMTKAEVDALKASAERGNQAADKLEKKELTDSVKAHVARGAIKSEQVDEAVEILQASAPANRIKIEKFLSELPDNKLVSAGEKGNSKENNLSASDQLNKMAEDLAAKDKLGFSDALRQVQASDPALAKQAAAEIDETEDDDEGDE